MPENLPGSQSSHTGVLMICVFYKMPLSVLVSSVYFVVSKRKQKECEPIIPEKIRSSKGCVEF